MILFPLFPARSHVILPLKYPSKILHMRTKLPKSIHFSCFMVYTQLKLQPSSKKLSFITYRCQKNSWVIRETLCWYCDKILPQLLHSLRRKTELNMASPQHVSTIAGTVYLHRELTGTVIYFPGMKYSKKKKKTPLTFTQPSSIQDNTQKKNQPKA